MFLVRIVALLGLVATVGCAHAPANPEALKLSKQLRMREGTIDRFCLDQEKVTSAQAIRDCRYYVTRARWTLRGKVFSDTALAQRAVRLCGLPKVAHGARGTATHNRRVAECYRQVFSSASKETLK